ncbi:type I-E CRISPR-associated protein Cse1/CasA [Actinokineospora sp. UTMC 2448]|uniref:type I-E CRISPR-associated protein Cse1/CasA n=1 Tax=Actinokineospora sp. UTMC 2448 TaxID=2268449 RepID=UPI0021641EC4|nr:type I-E CRISPR-associated protein Cse1/CasA [Actinokineospora sp. UTMC 2448]UVS78390.1 CRISPR-associated protein CasA [Actinokineospora sp. UTMC 2448]
MNACDRFDLTQRPWLTVRLTDGTVQDMSLVDVFANAHRVLGILGDVPTQVFALTRMLLAILHRATDGPAGLAQWRSLWQADTLPTESIDAYLAKHAHRFDLGDPDVPFFQVARLRTNDDKFSDLSKLIADVPNGQPFFTTRIGAPLRLSLAEAARWLVHCQAFDPSGIKSGDPSDPRTKNGKGYPIGVGWSGAIGGVLVGGRNLRETLLLNLVPRDVFDLPEAADLPPWEREHLGVTEELDGRVPTGPVDLFTWQSRRIRLVGQDGVVTAVLIANGDRRTPQNMHPYEPHTAWRRSQAQEKKLRSTVPVYMPLEHDPERMIWRGLQAMLPEADIAAGAERLPPTVLRWIGRLTSTRVLPRGYPMSLRTIGMTYGSQSSTVAEIVDDALSLRAILFAQDAGELVRSAKQAVAASEAGANAIGRLGENLAVAAGSREPAGARSRAVEHAYGALDPLFRTWLAGLGPDSVPLDALTEWHVTADQALRGLADDLVASASPTAWVGRPDRKGKLITSNHARKWCGDALRDAFAHAYQPVGSTS